MTQTKKAQEVDMMHVNADIAQIAGLLRQLNITGPIRDYAERRVGGGEIVPSLAQAAHAQAKALLNDPNTDSQLGLSVGILTSLIKDISSFAKVAASRAEINKLANLFEKSLS